MARRHFWDLRQRVIAGLKLGRRRLGRARQTRGLHVIAVVGLRKIHKTFDPTPG